MLAERPIDSAPRAHAGRPTQSRLGLLLLTGMLLFAPPGAPAQIRAPQPDLAGVLAPHLAAIERVGSDEEARQLFMGKVGPALGLAAASRTGRLASPPPADTDGVRFIAEAAAWRLAGRIREAADANDPTALSRPLESQARTLDWLIADPSRASLARAARIARTLAALPAPPSRAPEGFEAFAAPLDRQYWNLTQGEASWLALAEQDGAAGIVQRLATGHDGDGSAAWYVATRIAPVLRAAVAASALRAEAEAERAAMREWERLRSADEELRARRGQQRLCGTWQWTIHNHQNHQEHKVFMVFPPPDPATPSSPRLTRMVVQGDTIYLRWEFPGGYQEESLLFGSEGQRVEGTFVNSRGAWGSITGKKGAPCKVNAER